VEPKEKDENELVLTFVDGGLSIEWMKNRCQSSKFINKGSLNHLTHN
jgi:D-citramalate synthase